MDPFITIKYLTECMDKCIALRMAKSPHQISRVSHRKGSNIQLGINV